MLKDRHLEAAQMVRDAGARAALEHELDAIAHAVAATLESSSGPLTPRARDEVAAAGELWSSRLLAALLNDCGIPATWIDAREIVRTDSLHGGAAADLEATREAAARLLAPLVAGGTVPVLGGFIGADPHGATTTLGRGGSDCSAAVVGASLDAAEIQIWTDVDGVLTADPRVVPHARLVPRLSYGEAHDLAAFGAKVLHPGTIQPAIDRNIPVLVRNSHRPAAQGTLVTTAGSADETRRVAGLACRTGVVLLEAIAPGDVAADGFVARVFEALRECGAEAELVDLCGNRLVLTLESPDEIGLRASLSALAGIRLRESLATVSVVGEGIVLQPRLAADAAAALRDLPVHLVAQPPGGRTLAFVIDAADSALAVRRLHDHFFGVEALRPPASRAVAQV
jgi:aspartate kinase